MNLNELEKKLIAAARKNEPSDKVPYAFEKRIMARITAPVADAWSAWSSGLWRAATTCVIIVAAVGVWSLSTGPKNDDTAQDFENVVFASFDQHVGDVW